MDNNLVDIVEFIVSKINTSLEVVSIDGDIVYLCNTLHLTECKIITDESGNEYTITDFKLNEWVKLEPFGHAIPFSGSVLNAPPLTYLHGDPMSTNSEYLDKEQRTSQKTPFIWLVESYSYSINNADSVIEKDFNVRLFFMDWADTPQWQNKDHNKNCIKPMENLLKEFLLVIENDFNFKRLDNVNTSVRNRFGADVFTLEIDEDLSGIDVSFNLQVYDISLCKC